MEGTIMRAVCESCGWDLAWEFIDEYTDSHGVKWEVYQCLRCGDQKQFAVG
jgi:NAD-dependent SIR2 family protein deacetylase